MEAELGRFGKNVRNARRARGWTQEELAHRTGLSSVQISRIERGRREIRLTTPLYEGRIGVSPRMCQFGVTPFPLTPDR
jgi:transcriptional regulator with XRE-family HTH domain